MNLARESIGIVLCSLLFLAVGCGKKEIVPPAKVAQLFTIELARGDMDKAKQYATPEMASVIEPLKKLNAVFQAEQKKTSFKFIVLEQRVEGHTAQVRLKFNNRTQSYELVKEKNVWKVSTFK